MQNVLIIALYALLSRRIKLLIAGAAILLAGFVFLKYTTIGNFLVGAGW